MLELINVSEGCDGQGAGAHHGFADGTGFGDGLRAGNGGGGGKSYIINMAYGEGDPAFIKYVYGLDAVDLLIRLTARECLCCID